jgi:hypothetical protein
MKRLLLAAALSAGCPPNRFAYPIGGEALPSPEDAVYFELRGVDPGTSLPFHDIVVWFMPLADACSEWGVLAGELADLRLQLDDGLDPNTFCASWTESWSARGLDEPFAVTQWRLHAEPRDEDVDPDTAYPFHDELTEPPTGPSFDATIAAYPAPDLAGCAEPFNGGPDWQPTLHEAAAGEIDVARYAADEHVAGSLLAAFDDADEAPVRGAFDTPFCPEAQGWPVAIALSLD